MSIKLAYVTHSDLEAATLLAKTLVEEKLIACANIIPSVKSCYMWEGQYHESYEVVLILKTKEELFSSLRERVLQLHDYTTPCVMEIDVKSCSAGYKNWLLSNTL